MTKYEPTVWNCGDEDLDRIFEAPREKIRQIIDENVKAALLQHFKDASKCLHVFVSDEIIPAGTFQLSLFEVGEELPCIDISIAELVDDITEEGAIDDEIERPLYLYREAWARVFDQAAANIRAASTGRVVEPKDPDDISRKINDALIKAAKMSGLVDDLL